MILAVVFFFLFVFFFFSMCVSKQTYRLSILFCSRGCDGPTKIGVSRREMQE